MVCIWNEIYIEINFFQLIYIKNVENIIMDNKMNKMNNVNIFYHDHIRQSNDIIFITDKKEF